MPFKPGESGNYNGRPKGATSKALTDQQLANLLSKGTKGALEVVKGIMCKSKNENAKLRAALAWLGHDKAMREFLYKKVIDKENTGIYDPKDHLMEDDKNTPEVVVSLKAISGGKDKNKLV